MDLCVLNKHTAWRQHCQLLRKILYTTKYNFSEGEIVWLAQKKGGRLFLEDVIRFKKKSTVNQQHAIACKQHYSNKVKYGGKDLSSIDQVTMLFPPYMQSILSLPRIPHTGKHSSQNEILCRSFLKITGQYHWKRFDFVRSHENGYARTQNLSLIHI